MHFKKPVYLLCLCLGLLTGQTAAARMLVIGTISDEPVKETRAFLPFARHLAAQLQDQGITGASVTIARDISDMSELLRTGAVDIYIDSPLVSLAVRAECGSRLLARRWKKGTAQYQSVIFARRDSGIRSLKDLKGKVVAFEEPFSSSGYILPRLAIGDRIAPLTALPDPRAARPASGAAYVFSGDDGNTIEWVLRGLVDAGAMSLQGLKMQAGGDFDDLSIILETKAIPRHVVSVPPDASAAFSRALLAVLTGMDQSAAGRSALLSFEETSKFDPIPAPTLNLLKQFQTPVALLIGGG
ncbi:phosphate/phosphite/phosphonate ABC transporter substrate-binding protein (plasmid) [Leisingera sp. M527]|uniref:phosphate/phosphite/phosphonate ABC transporter substrate-binding protein n=1 Tax=unclassified Leisingera TaxID=2614906 RepID=UPI0021A31181|nr:MULTISPECIES: phosphate/phosphite/phosphonate ABC transporter substrate-binding protein [unclassified Leisingera]UWQ35708.1 phosphate/phosphite/phosphonate ABC transporter substrate-binding protein [Leisingera sp. M527]UWQ77567.1 phosphate/phosphite/phosphonate ABC transporter substrate-binding protein [Leisingera sp. M658]